MKLIFKDTVWVLFFVLLAVNIYIFVSGIRLSNELSSFDQQTRILHQQNLELNTQLSHVDSLQYAASMAARLNFVQKSTPVYLDNLTVAQNILPKE